MRAGAGLMQIKAQIPAELVDVLQATILLFLVAGPVLRRVLRLLGEPDERRGHGPRSAAAPAGRGGEL